MSTSLWSTFPMALIQLCGKSAPQFNVICQATPVRFRGRQLLTAQIMADKRYPRGFLSLVSWRVKADGAIIQTGESAPYPMSSGENLELASIDMMHATRAVTVFTDADVIRIVTWDVNDTGAISLNTEMAIEVDTVVNTVATIEPAIGENESASDDKATTVKVLPITDTIFVIAISKKRGVMQPLRLVSFRLENNGSLAQLHSLFTTMRGIQQLSLVKLDCMKQGYGKITQGQLSTYTVAATIIDGKGQLGLITWNLSTDGFLSQNSSQMLATTTMKQVDSICDEEMGLLISSVASDGKALLHCWGLKENLAVSQFDDVPDYSATLGAESWSECLLMRWHDQKISRRIINVVRNTAGLIQLSGWEIDPEGEVSQFAEGQKWFKNGQKMWLCREKLEGIASIVTSVRHADNSHQLISWSFG